MVPASAAATTSSSLTSPYPEVERHVHDTLIRLIETYELDLLRLDYNILQVAGGEREVTGAADGAFMENTQWRYYDALYRIFDDLHRRYPKLLLENCASGGGRNDLGMLSRFHWTQVSDNWEPQGQLKIFNGTTLALPPEAAMPILGAVSPGVADLDFMLRIGLFGHFCACGSFPSPREIHEESLPALAPRDRPLQDLRAPLAGRKPPLPPHARHPRKRSPADWCVLELASADRVPRHRLRLAPPRRHRRPLSPLSPRPRPLQALPRHERQHGPVVHRRRGNAR